MRRLRVVVLFATLVSVSGFATLTLAAVPYILVQGSTYQEGCFAPCLCPMLISAPLAGTFRMDSLPPSDVFDSYAVEDVRWFAASDAVTRKITGSGTYKISETADQQDMTLDLTIDQNPPATFTSGMVPITVRFPDVTTTISMNGGVCRDTVMHVQARPTPRLDVERDVLVWDSGLEIPGYDVVVGKLRALRETGGDFSVAISGCLANDLHDHTAPFFETPLPNEGLFVLVRAGASTYDTGAPSQVRSRDPGIAASPNACP